MYWLRNLVHLTFCATALAAAASKGGVSHKGNVCTVTALGGKRDDVPNILEAFSRCGKDGTIVFPEDQNYWIATRLNPVVSNVMIDWRGVWTLSDDLDYWRNHSYPITFQNHHAGFVLTGDHITIQGHGTGQIYGNGNAWYNAEKAVTQPGRPMPFVFWNVSEVLVEDFTVKDPPLWSLNIMNGTNMVFNNITCNATAVNAPYGTNWVQNTDGFDTMDVNNVELNGLTYQGGDDCIAIKPRSYNVRVSNVLCHGGNGIAIGSLGQYLEDASVKNVVVDNVNVISYNEDMHNAAYIKTYMGGRVLQSSYESAGLPNGGGWGTVENILFSNFNVQGAKAGPAITQDTGDNGTFKGTSLMAVSNVAFVNFTGYLSGASHAASVSCSNVHPCYNIDFQNVNILPSQNATAYGNGTCSYTAPGGVHGLAGCS